jgi:hypothetical protein
MAHAILPIPGGEIHDHGQQLSKVATEMEQASSICARISIERFTTIWESK